MVITGLKHVKVALDEMQNQAITTDGNFDEEQQKLGNSLAMYVHQVAAETYFASGAYNGSNQDMRNTTKPSELHVRFYEEAQLLFYELARLPFASSLHYLLRTLEYFIETDPPGIFKRIGDVVTAGQVSGYQYEAMAADQIVQIVERYLAEYQSVFRSDAECRTKLMKILDIFVGAGWPNARRLTFRLEEVFR
jgi:hypothetical protein